MLVDEGGHLEHRNLLLAAENLLEVVVRIDHALVLLILQAVGLDVVPHLLRHFASRHRLGTDHRAELCARRYLSGQTFSAALGSTLFRSRHRHPLSSFPRILRRFAPCVKPDSPPVMFSTTVPGAEFGMHSGPTTMRMKSFPVSNPARRFTP